MLGSPFPETLVIDPLTSRQEEKCRTESDKLSNPYCLTAHRTFGLKLILRDRDFRPYVYPCVCGWYSHVLGIESNARPLRDLRKAQKWWYCQK